MAQYPNLYAARGGGIVNSTGQVVNEGDAYLGDSLKVMSGTQTDVIIPQVRHGAPGNATVPTVAGTVYTALPVNTSRAKRTRIVVQVQNVSTATAGKLVALLTSGGVTTRKEVTATSSTSGGNTITTFDTVLEAGYTKVAYEFTEGSAAGSMYGVISTVEGVVI